MNTGRSCLVVVYAVAVSACRIVLRSGSGVSTQLLCAVLTEGLPALSYFFCAGHVASVGCFIVRKCVVFLADSPVMTASVSISTNVVSSLTRPMISVIASSTRCLCVCKVVDRSSRWRPVTVPWALSGS